MTWLNVALFALTLFATSAEATLAPEAWRKEVASVRALAENDAQQAYLQAQHLQTELPAGATPSDRARALNLLARIELYLGFIDKSAKHSAEAREFAKRSNDRPERIEANLIGASSAINLGRLDDMVEATRDNMDMLVGLDSEEMRAEAMFHVAMMYLRFGQIDEAVTVAMQSLDVARNGNSPMALAYSEQGLASVYMQSGRYAEAGDHYRSMRDAARQARSTLLEAAAMLGLSSVASHLGERSEAERLNLEAIALFRRIGGSLYVAHAVFQLADQYFVGKQPAKALPLLDENVATYEAHDNPIGLWWTLNKRSSVLQALGRLAAARNDAERAGALAKKVGYTVYLAGSARRLAEVTAAQGDFERAYRLSAEAAELAGKLEQEKAGKRILELAQRFQEESKQRKIDELNRNNERQHARQDQLLIVLAAMILLLGITVVFVLRLRRSREEIRALNAGLEQRVLERTTELVASQQSLSEAQRIAHVGSWEMNLVDNELTWSDEIYRIFEIDPQRFGASYEAFMETVHPDDRALLDRTYKAALENREHFEIEHRLLLPDGRIKYVHERGETTYDDNGRPLRTLGTVQDITERKEMDTALRESRELLAEAQRIAKVGSWEYDIVNDIHAWSDELFRIYEIDPVAAGATYDGCLNATHPDDREAVARAYLDSLETGKAYESEHRLLMADGRIKYVHERGETICAPDGSLVRALGMMQDVTERVLAERKLKEALEFAEGIINAIPDILFEVDREGRYLNVWTQHPELLAAQRKTLLGRTAREVLSPEAAAAALEAIREADEKGYSQSKDIFIDLPQGRRWFAHTLSRKPGGAPGEATFLVLSRDITERKLLEEALAERERELRALAESSPGMMGSFHLKPDGTVCMPYVSPNISDLFGLQPEQVAKDAAPLIWLNHPDDAQRVRDSIAESARTMTPWHCEYRIAHPTKGERWMEGRTNPQAHPDGGTIWYGYVHDITERKHMEAALQESEARYRYHFNLLQSMLESAASVSVFALDRDYRYLFFNNRHREGAKRLRGTDIEIGMSMVETMPDPEFREFCRQGFDRVLAGHVISVESKEKLVTDGVTTYEYNDNYGSPIFNDAGEVVGLTVFAINTTERKRLEAELRESHTFLNRVMDAVPDPIFVKDRQHRWVMLNDAFCDFIGHLRASLLDKSDYDFFPKEQADVFWEKDEQVFDSGEVNLNEENFTSADGVTYFIQTKKTPFVSADGRQMLVGVIRDISERKQLEAAREAALAEAERLAKQRSDFLSHMSHELRTPLNGILGYAQLLQRDPALAGRNADAIQVIRQSGEHLLSLIDDILDLARIDAGRFELEIDDIALPVFLRVVCNIIEVRAKDKGIGFECVLPPALPPCVRGDERRLRQVLLNLLSNAIKFTDRGKVELRVSRRDAARFLFEVEDTGVGIAESEIETIFQPFEQAGDAAHRTGGTGLGLSISRQLVRLMGGEISVESRVGKGSLFRFELELPQCGDVPRTEFVPADKESEEGRLAAEPVIPPPRDELLALRELALLGNMRDILQYAGRIEELDPRYRRFAAHLRELADGFQSKAILAFIEEHLSRQQARTEPGPD